jgi:hypothetical protein
MQLDPAPQYELAQVLLGPLAEGLGFFRRIIQAVFQAP